jgi:hypothetical protein
MSPVLSRTWLGDLTHPVHLPVTFAPLQPLLAPPGTLFFFFWAVMGFELKASRLLGLTRATLPAL